MATVSVFGLGYVGSVVAACLAESGHGVIGVDANPEKADLVAAGRSPVRENGLEPLLRKGVERGLIQTTTDPCSAVRSSDISLVCVGTPSNETGAPDLTHIRAVSEQIGCAMKSKGGYHIAVVRSTILPGTTEDFIIPILEQSSGRKACRDFGICFNPEFLREGTSIQDFYEPPITVIGSQDERAAEAASSLYANLSAPLALVSVKVAEMLKYASNSFHALKVCFGNEIGNVCRRLGIDSHQVMELFCKDHKLNLSSTYLKPGFAFGGSCLPKDVRGLVHLSRHLDLDIPVLESILSSNARQVESACRMVERTGKKRIGIVGFTFKEGTDDLRESPMVRLIEHLIGRGYAVKVYDENVSVEQLSGANRTFIDQAVPHITSLMVDSLDRLVDWSEAIVIGARCRGLESAASRISEQQTVIDLVRPKLDLSRLNGNYSGICW